MSAWLRHLRYFASDAADEWRHSPGVNLLATLTLAAALFLAGLALLLFHNVEARLVEWRREVRVSVYLSDPVETSARAALRRRLEAIPGVSRVEQVGKDEALRRFRLSFGDLADVPAVLGTNPLPESLEAYLAPGVEADAAARAVVAAASGREGVEEVRYDRAWLDRMDGALRTGRLVGAAAGLAVLVAVAFVMAGVLRLAVHARQDEIEIMLLVGAPRGLVRGPFLFSGVAQGLAASLLAAALVEGARRGFLAWAGASHGAAVDLVAGAALPPAQAGLLLAAGIGVGLGSSFFAVRRLAEPRAG